MSKFIPNSQKRNTIYIECECGEHILKLEKLNTSDEIILSCIQCDDCFTIYEVKKINQFYNLCTQVLNNVKQQVHISNDEYLLKLFYEKDLDYYNFILTNWDEDDIYWDVCFKYEAFEEFVLEIKAILDNMIKSKCRIKTGAKVRVKNLQNMSPLFIDEIGRYHFDLYDGSDIVFNEEMKEFCGNDYIINNISPYIDKNGEVRCTFCLKPIGQCENPNVIWYTFTLDMVEVI